MYTGNLHHNEYDVAKYRKKEMLKLTNVGFENSSCALTNHCCYLAQH